MIRVAPQLRVIGGEALPRAEGVVAGMADELCSHSISRLVTADNTVPSLAYVLRKVLGGQLSSASPTRECSDSCEDSARRCCTFFVRPTALCSPPLHIAVAGVERPHSLQLL